MSWLNSITSMFHKEIVGEVVEEETNLALTDWSTFDIVHVGDANEYILVNRETGALVNREDGEPMRCLELLEGLWAEPVPGTIVRILNFDTPEPAQEEQRYTPDCRGDPSDYCGPCDVVCNPSSRSSNPTDRRNADTYQSSQRGNWGGTF